MKNRRNYYRLLQVQPDAPIEVIRASYRTLMRELKQHPDLGGSSSHAAMLNEAYRTLSHHTLRAEYDRKLFLRYTKQSLSTPAFGQPTHAKQLCPFCKAPLTRQAQPGQICSVCQSPLQSEGGMAVQDRRALVRIKRNDRIYYWSKWPQEPQEAKMIDISPQGMRLLCGQQVKPGTVLKISGPGFKASAIVMDLCSEEVDGEKLYAVGVSFLGVAFERPRGSFLSTLA
jgi:hypothetical protein